MNDEDIQLIMDLYDGIYLNEDEIMRVKEILDTLEYNFEEILIKTIK